MAFMLNKDGAFLVKGSGQNTKFCTTCCNGSGGGGDKTFEFMAASAVRIRSSWYEVTLHSHPVAGHRVQANDADSAADDFISGVTVSISGCSGHQDCSCNGTSRNGNAFNKAGAPSEDITGVFTANYTIDACPNTYGREEQTHQITILFRRIMT